MLERILVPIDGSADAGVILPHVRRLARRAGSEVIILRALDGARPLRTAPREVNGAVEALTAVGIDARARVADGSAVNAILETARQERASLVAMATHGRSGLPRWSLGSVTEEVLRAGTTPLLVVRSAGGEEGGSCFRDIVLATDGNPLALEPVPLVATFARLFDSRVTVVHFVSDYAGASAMSAAEEHVASVCAALAEQGVLAGGDLRRGVAASGIPAYGLLEPGQDHPVDLIAMATHGRSGARRWILGSVTERVLRSTIVPVLVSPAPPQQRRSPRRGIHARPPA
jgi:nucleotide-binding universal stress UspA family protein